MPPRESRYPNDWLVLAETGFTAAEVRASVETAGQLIEELRKATK